MSQASRLRSRRTLPFRVFLRLLPHLCRPRLQVRARQPQLQVQQLLSLHLEILSHIVGWVLLDGLFLLDQQHLWRASCKACLLSEEVERLGR
jgi:hypothetical protein